MSDCRFGVSPVNYPDPDPEQKVGAAGAFFLVLLAAEQQQHGV